MSMMKQRKFAVKAFTSLLLVGILLGVFASIPQAQATTTYVYDDTDGGYLTITATSATTIPFNTLRTQDRAAVLKHKLHPRMEVAGYDWETSPLASPLDSDYEVRPLDDIALKLKVVVQSYSVAGNLTIDGTDWRGATQSEVITINADGTYQTTNYFRTVTLLSDDGVLTCEWQLWQDRWGIFGYNLGYPSITTEYILQGYLTVGNYITFTPLATITSTYGLLLRSDSGSATYGFIHVDSGGVLMLGKLENATAKTVSFGVQLHSTAAGCTIENDGGTVNFYGTDISFCQGQVITSLTGSITRVWAAKVTGQTGNGFQGVGYDFFNVIVNKQACLINAGSYVFSGSIDKVEVTSGMAGGIVQGWGGAPCSVTASNIYARKTAYVVWLWGNQAHTSNYTLINFDVDPWAFSYGGATGWTGKVWRKYTFDAHTQLENGTFLAGVLAVGEYANSYGQAFSATSNGNGNITSQTVDYGFYNRTGGNAAYRKTPLKVTYSKSGYQTLVKYYNITEKTKDIVVLKPNTSPVARFSYSPLNPQPSQMISFDGSLSTDPDGSIVGYSWKFGDSQTGSGSTVQHAYATAGTYSVNLSVTDNQGLTDSFVQSVFVEAISQGGGQNVGLNIAPNFDINILKMPSYVVSTSPVWSRTFTMQTTVHNKGSFQQEVTLSYWLTVAGKSAKVWEGKQSFLLQSKETRPVDIEYSIPSEKGNYTAYAKVTYPAGSEGSLVQQSFTNYDVPSWFTTEGLIFLILLLAVPSAIFSGWATKEEKWSEWFDFD
jgi:PKD repeat protein